MHWTHKKFVALTFLAIVALSGASTQARTPLLNLTQCTSSGSFALDWLIDTDMKMLNFLFSTNAIGCIQEGQDDVRYESFNNAVFIGKNRLINGFDPPYDSSLWPVPWAIAHEYAHSMQKARGFPYPNSKWSELHADFMAGWYLAYRIRYTQQDLARPLLMAWKMESISHGKSWERVVATAAGITSNLTFAKTNANAAYLAGLVYVTAFKLKSGE
jgi:hypothetical protein